MLILLVLALVLCVVKVCTVLTNFQCTANTCLVGKVAIVTGGNSGIGFEYVLDLASRGCKVIIADISNGEQIVAKIKEETGNENIIWKYIDLGSLASVRKFAAEILKTESRLDLLINNAGCGSLKGFTKDGLQKVMQINYFGHFLLTHLLVDLLKTFKKSRVVGVSSVLAFTNVLNKPELINTEPEICFEAVDGAFQYGNSKLCVLIAMKVMAEKLKKHGISCYSIHPGAIQTKIFETSFENSTMYNLNRIVLLFLVRIFIFLFGKTTREGAQTGLQCALSKEVEGLSGKYFWNGSVFREPAIANDKKFCLQIWKESEKLVKLAEDEKLC